MPACDDATYVDADGDEGLDAEVTDPETLAAMKKKRAMITAGMGSAVDGTCKGRRSLPPSTSKQQQQAEFMWCWSPV